MARKRTTQPRQPDDARVQRSIEALQKAFLGLLEQQSLEQISIKEIAGQAGLSYPTFFRRFGNKQELLESIAAKEVQHLLSLSGAAALRNEWNEASRNMIQYVKENRKLWEALLVGGAADAMRDEFKRVARRIGESRPQINPWLPVDLSIAFVTSGFFEILAWWMRQPPDYPAENIVIFFDELIGRQASRRRDIQLHG